MFTGRSSELKVENTAVPSPPGYISSRNAGLQLPLTGQVKKIS